MKASESETTPVKAGARDWSPGFVALLGCCLAVITTAVYRIGYLDIPSDPVEGFLFHYWVAYLAFAVAAVAVHRRPTGSRMAVAGILLGAAVIRVAAWSFPVILETDPHRYIWDGFVVSRGFNPYQFSPSEVLGRRLKGSLAFDDQELYDRDTHRTLLALRSEIEDPLVQAHLQLANHPEVPTCYPPVAQLAFGLCALVRPGNLWFWKAFVACVDLVICLMVLALLMELGRSPSWVLLYAWCPLPIKEYANTGHYDPVATLFVLVAVFLLMKGRRYPAALALGTAISAKVYPLVLLPVFFRRLRLGGCLVALGTSVAFYLPFMGIGLSAFDGLLAFAKDWEFNSSIFALVQKGFAAVGVPEADLSLLLQPRGGAPDFLLQVEVDAHLYSKAFCGLAGVLVLGLLSRWEEEAEWSWPARAYAAVGALFLLSPVADPWYLPWVLPYAALFPSFSALFLAGTVSNYYLYFIEYDYLWWARLVEYLPFYGLLGQELAAGTHPALGRALDLGPPAPPADG